jgi:hypothetical protein
MREPGYREALLVYIDILGFRSIIQKSATESHLIGSMLSVLQDLKRQTSVGGRVIHEEGKPVSIFRGFNFSDLTVRATYIDTSTKYVGILNWEFLYLSGIQAHLLCYGNFLLRGAISNGLISMEPDKNIPDDVVFGPALVRSYELETYKAVYPRIIIDSEVIGKANQNDDSLWTNYIHRDDDGEYFLDYLFGAATDDLLGEPGKPFGIIKTMQLHRENTEGKIYSLVERDERIIAKLRWLVLYHNSVVQRLKKHYEKLPDPFDQFDQQPIEIPDALLIDEALLDTV